MGNEQNKWQIATYETEDGRKPVDDFIRALPSDLRAKTIHEIDLLEEFGIGLRKPHVGSIKGDRYKGLWELRAKQGSDITRIFYFLPYEKKFILLHGFVKKDDKTPKRELETALSRMKDWKRRFMK